jgi:hypothetical protein
LQITGLDDAKEPVEPAMSTRCRKAFIERSQKLTAVVKVAGVTAALWTAVLRTPLT